MNGISENILDNVVWKRAALNSAETYSTPITSKNDVIILKKETYGVDSFSSPFLYQ